MAVVGVVQKVQEKPSGAAQGGEFGSACLKVKTDLLAAVQQARELVTTVVGATEGAAKLESGEGQPEVDLVQDAVFLRAGLKTFQRMAFESQQDIGVSAGKLNKVTKRLCLASEAYVENERAILETSGQLSSLYEGYRESTCYNAARTLQAIAGWDASGVSAGDLAGRPALAKSVLNGIEKSGKVEMALFVCPPVDFSRLSGDFPGDYMQTSFRGSLLSRQAQGLSALFRSLEEADVAVSLRTVIGDTDEDLYIWPVIGGDEKLDPAIVNERRAELRDAAAEYISENLTQKNSIRPRIFSKEGLLVEGLSGIEAGESALAVFNSVLETPLKYFTAEDIDTEIGRMRELWRPADYYEGLPVPTDRQMEEIVIRKFAAYAMQGVMLAGGDTDLVLIQTERPADLRTRMLNAGRKALGLNEIPVVNMYRPEE